MSSNKEDNRSRDNDMIRRVYSHMPYEFNIFEVCKVCLLLFYHSHEFGTHPRTPSTGFKKLTCLGKRQRLVTLFKSSTGRNLEPFHLHVFCQTDPHQVQSLTVVTSCTGSISKPDVLYHSAICLRYASLHSVVLWPSLHTCWNMPWFTFSYKTLLDLTSCSYISCCTLSQSHMKLALHSTSN